MAEESWQKSTSLRSTAAADLANLTTPACSLESDLPSGGRTGTARNQRLALLQLASPSRPAR